MKPLFYRGNKTSRQSNFVFALTLFCVSFFIVSGNALNFRLFDFLNVKLSEILLSLNLVLIFCRNIFSGNKSFRRYSTKSYKLLLTWIVYASFIGVIKSPFKDYSLSQLLTGVFYSARLLFYIFYAYEVSSLIIDRPRSLKLANCITLSFLVVCLIGFFQLLVYPVAYDWYAIFYKLGVYLPNPDPHINRLISTFFDPNYLSSCLLIPFVISLNFLFTRFKERGVKTLSVISIVTIVISIFLTKSRSGFLGLMVIVCIYLLKILFSPRISTGVKTLILIVFCVAVMILFTSDIPVITRLLSGVSDHSSQARFESWKLGFAIFAENPVLGIGYNMIGAYKSAMLGSSGASTLNGLDSSLILVLVCGGSVGLFIYSAYVISIYTNPKISFAYKTLFFAGLVICNFNQLLFYPLWMAIMNILYFSDLRCAAMSSKSKRYDLAIKLCLIAS